MRLALVLAVLALPVAAQEAVITSPIDGSTTVLSDVPENDVRALAGQGVEIKGLDKVSGIVSDLLIPIGEAQRIGRLEVLVEDCRYPEDNAAGEGYAWLSIKDTTNDTPIFDGWMVASSPALNALDHPRYDVWVIRCTTS